MQYNLFPSADMILSLSRECGTEEWELTERVDVKVDTPSQPVRIKRQAPLDTHNETYKKQLKPKPCKDFIQVTKRNLFSSVLLRYWPSGRASALKLAGCWFDTRLGHTKD